MAVFWLLVLAVIVLVVWQVLRGREPGVGGAGEDRAENVLRERYARGEIDEEEYRRKLDELRR